MSATDSLVIADLFELMGAAGGVQSDIPELVNSAGVGAKFQLLSPESSGQASSSGGTWDLGAPQPTVDIVQSLLLDGERPFGARSSNRTITLPIKITAPDQITLTAARELLMAATDKPMFTMTWTPSSSGLAMVFDCFRALPAVYSYGFLQAQPIPISIITLQFQALPYGRSEPTALQNVAFSSPIVGGVAAPPAPVVVDAFGSLGTGANWTRVAAGSQFVVGPSVVKYTPPVGQTYPWLTASYAKTGLSVNLAPGGVKMTALSVWLGQSFDTGNWAAWAPFQSNVTLRWTLTDNGGHKLAFSKSINSVPWASTPSTPKWTRFTAPIPQTSATFNYASLASYSLTLTNWTGGGKSSWVRMYAWLDAITANPPSLAAPASQRGVVYNIMGAAGTARTPVSSQFQLPQAGPVSAELTGSGLWWPPLGVTSVQAECVGAGGSGGALTTTGLGGGGGGGAYAAEATLTVAAGTPVPYSCGVGGQSGATAVVTTFSQPGTGNWTCPAGVTTVKAECYGGGGQGAAGGGGGGGGEYAAEASLAVTAGKVYKFTVGKGGYNTQYGFGNAGNGSSTTFGPSDTPVTVTAHGGLMAKSGGTVAGVGGTGSGNTTHNNGGSGGTSPGYGGGGGGSSGYPAGAGGTGSAGSGNTGGAGSTTGTGGDGGAGATSPGFPVMGVAPGGGGGGGFGGVTASAAKAGNNAGAAGGAGQIVLTYTVAGGSPVNGGATTFGSALSTSATVTANGGSAAALNSATGGAGGTVGSNTVKFAGGAGGLGGTDGGGGGGSGGSASIGTAGTAGASGGAGAVAVTGGGKGGNGSVTNGVPGDGATPPGGGGGGGRSTGTTVAGGAGGDGNIILTWTPPIAPFSTLIAHRPGAQSPPELNPCVPINNTADAPTGTQYAVPSLVTGVNALFKGTYTVVLVNYNWDSPSMSRQITVTVNQYEYGGTPGNQQSLNYPLSVTRALTPSTDITNGIVIMGELTLPVKAIDPSNTSGYFTVSISDTDINDQFLDVLFLDTQGSTVLVNIPNNAYTTMMIDEPTPDRDLGLILGSDLDRSQAISVMDSAIISGSPFYIVPGDNLFLAYTVTGAPNLGVSYLNRWYLERLS